MLARGGGREGERGEEMKVDVCTNVYMCKYLKSNKCSKEQRRAS